MAVHKMPLYVAIGKWPVNAATYANRGKPKVISASETKPTARSSDILAILKFDLEIDEGVLDITTDTGITIKVAPPPAPTKNPPTKTVVKGIVAELHQMEEDVEDLLQK